jgi:hypothetical protein
VTAGKQKNVIRKQVFVIRTKQSGGWRSQSDCGAQELGISYWEIGIGIEIYEQKIVAWKYWKYSGVGILEY